jgi:arsenite oxidase small subunit
MKRCNAMVDAGRRKFLTGAGVVAAGAAASAVAVPDAQAAPAPARVSYPSNQLANAPRGTSDLLAGTAASE